MEIADGTSSKVLNTRLVLSLYLHTRVGVGKYINTVYYVCGPSHAMCAIARS